MNNTLGKIVIFIGGALIGSAITYKVLVNKYEVLIEEEIESVKAAYEDLHENAVKEAREQVHSDALESARKLSAQVTKDMESLACAETEKTEYRNIASQYAKNSDNSVEENDKEEGDDMVQPYTIHPDEFGDTDYDQKCLTLYDNGIIEDDFGDTWDDDEVERLLGGDENLKRMGEFEDDMLYIRNDNVKIDYEIARDLAKYNGD